MCVFIVCCCKFVRVLISFLSVPWLRSVVVALPGHGSAGLLEHIKGLRNLRQHSF